MKTLLLAACLALALPALAASNLARGRSYTLSPAPNYALCSDPQDKIQLTDGRPAGPECFWTQPAAVGWATANPIEVRLDLGAVQAIAGVTLGTASRLNAGVEWPSALVAVSDDGRQYRFVGRMAARPVTQEPTREYRQTLRLEGLRARGRHVLLYLVPGGSYLFCDEVEVLGGDHDPWREPPAGSLLGPEGFGEYTRLGRRQSWLEGECRRLASGIASQAREAATRGDKGGAAKLQAIAASLEALARRVPGLPLDPERVAEARRQAAGFCARANGLLHRGVRLLAWDAGAWEPLSPLEVPARGAGCRELVVHAASNEYSSLALALTNCTGRPLSVRVSLEDLVGDSARLPAAEVRVRRVEFVETAGNRVVADALPPVTGQGVLLPAGETSQLWLTLPKRPLGAGEYRGRLVLQVPGASVTVPLRLRVYPVELPDRMTLQTYNWAYVTTFGLVRGLEREAVADLFAHYTDTFVFTGVDIPWPSFDAQGRGSIDFTAHDRNLALHVGAREVSWFWGFADREQPDGGRLGAPYLGEEWKRRCAWWIHEWVAHLQGLGYGYDRFFMYPFDETLCPRFAALAAFLKQVDPRLRIFADPVSDDSREAIQAIAPAIDVWCPNFPSYRERPAEVELMRSDGGKLWTYVCDGPAKALPPHGYYRLLMWQAWRWGFTGCGFWAYADAGWQGDDAWDDFDGTHHDYAVIYTARHAPPGVPRSEPIIPSKRWEAWREGIEDYELLHLAQERVVSLQAQGQAGRAQALQVALDQAVSQVLAQPDQPAVLEQARRRLLEAMALP